MLERGGGPAETAMLSTIPAILASALLPLLTLDCVSGRNIHWYAGPYLGFVHQFEVCPSVERVVLIFRISHFNPVRPFDNQILSGNMTFRVDVMDNHWTFVDFAVRSNNQWKENAFIMNFPKTGCSSLRENVPDFFRIIAKYSGASTDKAVPCRVPAGRYIFSNEPVNWTFPHFPVMPYGHYRIRARARPSSTSTRINFCMILDVEAIPKPGG
ncbi:uncharacterized protein LOC117640127 isoform X1 [Thrips palmi]|uniref:Uncharacterized protein LOC117640127 isoform X1 n=1 Tax=Thrips palmi TaxID=161013 RepID=A0A6P8Y865_THRPL|nr:uncharacterized protein LOC117640127 isoform X1 [Thrips palmi]